MKCGVRFCGGCNPRYDRGMAFQEIKNNIINIDFEIAEENTEYDVILVIGGCTSCCASYKQFNSKEVIKMWQKDHIQNIISRIEQLDA